MDKELSTTQIVKLHQFYFTGNDLFGKLFNYPNLKSGYFRLFVNMKNFTYESDVFNSMVIDFATRINSTGNFYITTNLPSQYNLYVKNNFDYMFLNALIEKKLEIVKYTHSFLFDENYNWCIYLDNDMDIFISWCSSSHIKIFEQIFLKENEDFYISSEADKFIDIVVNRFSFKKDFDFLEYKKCIVENNKELLLA